MWSEAVFDEIARLSRPGTTAATWSVAARVRAGLQHAGFGIERRAGFARKREMLCARRPSEDTTGPDHGERRAVIVGAGIAGCWTAYTLARRGWTIDLVERHAAPAQEASGNPVGALLPAINLADNEKLGTEASVLGNGRRLTNIGTFRAYCVSYLRKHPHIAQDLTFIVRQLEPTEHGLPLEIYVFVNNTQWVFYEGVQADVFDHLLAVLPVFGLRVFQSPSGQDVARAADALAVSRAEP
jgi:hypothetical protein